jgi:hypothetical protein
MSVAKYAPSLPGYKPHESRDNNKKVCYFQTVSGHKFVSDRDGSSSPAPELGSSSSIASMGKSSSSKFFPSTCLDSTVLNFTATVSDAALDSNVSRERRCSILYHVDDGSIKIVEHAQTNSGIPQGTLLRRCIVQKEDGTPVTLDDIQYGEDIVIYGRLYSIVNCSGATRVYLENIGRTQIPPSKTEAEGELWGDMQDMSWSSFRREKNNLKEFMEAKLGNTVNNNGREGFQQYGNMILKFLCSWDDTERLYGDVSKFILCYHLADDTVEIFNKGSKELFPKLLKRAPLPREFTGSTTSFGENNSDPGDDFYHFTDFYIGAVLNVYSRQLVIHEADAATREFYEMMENPLGDPDMSFADPAIFEFTRQIPPHNGFGSEEDSLKSCVGPLCPNNPPSRSNVFESRVLSFFGHLVTEDSTDENRKFVISYYMQDKTVKIQEPPVRNSGFVGGLFLSRRRVKKVGGNGEYLNEHDFKVGEEIRLLTHKFKLIGANPFTLKWIAEQAE